MDLGSLHSLAFLTLPRYSMIACVNGIEVLRMANRLSGRDAYAWDVVTPDGAPAPASNGLTLQPTVALSAIARPDLLLACGGVDVRESVDGRVIAALRRLAREGVPLGSLCTGAFALASAGLLRGRRCAIHWENLTAIEEEFREIEFTGELFTVDRDRVTCTGGIAPTSLMLAMVEARLGAALAAEVAAQFLVERVRAGSERQRSAGVAAPEKLEAALRMMRDPDAWPLQAAAIARSVGLSARQLERLFRRHLGQTPAAYASGIRLDRARTLLRETAMPVTAIGAACGYATPSRFSAAYRGRFGLPPNHERRSRPVQGAHDARESHAHQP